MEYEWMLVYEGGRTFTNLDGKPLDAPPFGVLFLIHSDIVVGRKIREGWDFYYWIGDRWSCGDIWGVMDRLMHGLPVSALKQGRTIPDFEYRALRAHVLKLEGFPAKSAYQIGESARARDEGQLSPKN